MHWEKTYPIRSRQMRQRELGHNERLVVEFKGFHNIRRQEKGSVAAKTKFVVYRLHVQCPATGEDWTVERRFRYFLNLYKILKASDCRSVLAARVCRHHCFTCSCGQCVLRSALLLRVGVAWHNAGVLLQRTGEEQAVEGQQAQKADICDFRHHQFAEPTGLAELLPSGCCSSLCVAVMCSHPAARCIAWPFIPWVVAAFDVLGRHCSFFVALFLFFPVRWIMVAAVVALMRQ